MEIIIGKTAGFCYGVKRAVDGAIEESKKNKKTYCLGELVHNKEVIEDLKNKGIKIIEDINEAKDKNAKVILRAHGVEKNIYEKAKINNLELVDYTCSNVLKIHKIAEEYANKGYYIILTGAEKHPEVIGKNTICLATETRQKETEKLSKQVELMIIIGGKNSSNTKKLYEIAKQNCHNSISVENGKEAEETLKNMDLSTIEKVGIMAGASTPKESIDEVIEVWHLFK